MTSTIGAGVEDTARAEAMLALVASDSIAMSWDEMFDEYAPALSAFARSRGVREPEDLVQEVFVAAVEQLPRFVGDRSGLRSLLFTIAYRRIADEHRRFYRRPETLVADHAPSADPGPTVEEVIARRESAGRAMQALAVLTDRERRVIEMRILEEASPAKVGQALGLSSGNVRVIQARALAKIRMHLTSIGEGGFAQPMATGAAFTDFVRYLRTELPSDDVLGPWIEELRSDRSTLILDNTASASAATVTPGSLAATERVTESAYSLFSTVISSGITRIGAVVSVVALSTVPMAPAVVAAPSESPLHRADPVVEVQDTTPIRLFGLVDDTPGDVVAPDHDHASVDIPISHRPVAAEALERAATVFDEEAAREAGPPAGGLAEIEEETTPNLVDDLVEPLVEDTVSMLVNDVVTPVVTEVVQPLVTEVVEDTVELLVDDVVEPLVEDMVEPLVGGLTGTIGEVVGGLGGLLGG